MWYRTYKRFKKIIKNEENKMIGFRTESFSGLEI